MKRLRDTLWFRPSIGNCWMLQNDRADSTRLPEQTCYSSNVGSSNAHALRYAIQCIVGTVGNSAFCVTGRANCLRLVLCVLPGIEPRGGWCPFICIYLNMHHTQEQHRIQTQKNHRTLYSAEMYSGSNWVKHTLPSKQLVEHCENLCAHTSR